MKRSMQMSRGASSTKYQSDLRVLLIRAGLKKGASPVCREMENSQSEGGYVIITAAIS